MTGSLAIDLKNVAKTYSGGVQALRGVDMQVRRGEIFGLLGPNGAGKSTLVKILMTVISPTRAEGTVLGGPIGRKESLRAVGYLPEHHRFPDYLTGRQLLHYYASLSGVDRASRRARAEDLLDLVGMRDWGDTRVKGYSKGMRQRIGIAQALMNDPALVVLDEPTDGVDPVGRRDIREMLAVLKSRGKTVLLNSHLLSELEMVCDRVSILVQGRVSRQGTIDELTRDQRAISVEIADRTDASAVLVSCTPGADGRSEFTLGNGSWVRISGNTAKFAGDDPATVMPLVDALRAKGETIYAIRRWRPSLEDLFLQAVTDPGSGRVLKPGAAIGEGRP
ncbi:MAG: ABC transporter ATP-binding protein [Phycisphaerales bacterium]